MMQPTLQLWMVTKTLPNAVRVSILWVSGEFETGGIVHNLIAGIQYLDMDNDNDRYNADFLEQQQRFRYGGL